MKRQRLMAMLAALLIVCCAAGAQAADLATLRNMKYGTLTSYKNCVYGYELSVFSRLYMCSDEVLEQYLNQIDEQAQGTDADYIYDARIWLAYDSAYVLEVHVKEPTYDSFETEVAHAPDYAQTAAENYTPEEQFTQLHAGVLRDTPAGQMLEMAFTSQMQAEDGGTVTQTCVYYDYYGEAYEYIFMLTGLDKTYNETQSLLNNMMQTVQIGQVTPW